jgi:hypothetical protein
LIEGSLRFVKVEATSLSKKKDGTILYLMEVKLIFG